MPKGILSLKIDSCATMPTKRLFALLTQAASDCNRIKNAILRRWIRWREDNPGWQPQQRRDRKGKPKVTKTGAPVMESAMISQDMEVALYHTYKEIAPNVAGSVASGCWSKVLDELKANTPYGYQGSKFKWQAIVNYEINPATYTAQEIHVPSQSSVFTYTDDRLQLRFPLMSQTSGYKNRSPVVRLAGLSSHGISKGNQRLLKRIAAGELKRCDSRIIYRKGHWEYQLTYDVPVEDHGLNSDRVAVLTPLRSDKRNPFEIKVEDGPVWLVGDGIAYEQEVTRTIRRRKALQRRYRDGAGAGHGRKQFFKSFRPWSRKTLDDQDRFVKALVNEIIRFCIRNDCGTVLYREPTMPLRKLLWFDQRGVNFDWTKFGGYLAFKLESNSIDQVFRGTGRKKMPQRIGVKAHKAEYKWGKAG